MPETQFPNTTTANSTPTGVVSSPITISPSVITSKVATKELDDIKAQHSTIATNIANQATKVANDKILTDTATKEKAAAETAAKQAEQKFAIDKQVADAKTAAVTDAPTATKAVPVVGQTVYNPLTGKQTSVNAISKNPDGTYSVSFGDTPNTQFLNEDQVKNLASTETKTNTYQNKLDQAEVDYQTQAKQVQDTITNIQNGSVPLNEGQLAQVEGLKQAFQQMIEQQKLINIGASGTANIRGFQKGSAEYDPTFATKTIGSIVTAGINKVNDLNIKMASAVASLTEGFKTDNINAIKSAWNIYKEASDNRTKSLQKTIDDANQAIKDAQKAQEDAEKIEYERFTKPKQDILKDASKNGAPVEILQAINDAEDVENALAAAGDWLQTGAGIIGEYQFYKRDEEAAGKTPLSFDKYQTLDANRKAAIARASKPTVNETKGNAYSAINQLMGLKNEQGMPYLDSEGFFTAQGFKDIVRNSIEDGITRADIINQYGSFLSPYGIKSYGLSAKEAKDLGFTEE
jgi:hypothetical protein